MAPPIKILSVFGTRPEAIKFIPLLRAFEKDARFLSRVCATGQHRDMLDQVLTIANISPHYDLELMQPGQTLDALTASLLINIGKVLDREKPDWVAVQGDTATAMCGALAAYYRKIPVAHIEAGLRSGNIHHPWPEEANRKIIGGIAALHFAPTQGAADALKREAVDAATIHVTGNTGIDALHWITRETEHCPELAKSVIDLKQRFVGKRIVGVTTHRRESLGDGMAAIAEAVRLIAKRQDVAIIVPLHPNPLIYDIFQAALNGHANIALMEPLDYPGFVHLLDFCCVMLTDSGGVQEEAPAFGTPVLIMRETTERPEGVAAGTAKLVGTDTDTIVRECSRLLDDPVAYATMSRAHNPYGDGKTAPRIVEIMATMRTE